MLLLLSVAFWRVSQVTGFFGAGTLFLVGSLCQQSLWLKRGRQKLLQERGWWGVARLGFRNVRERPGRSVLCIALIASAAFIIVAVDAFRRDSLQDAMNRNSGNGGYTLLAESLLPLHHNLNTPDGRESLNLDSQRDAVLKQVVFSRFRVRPGDDASCLNLYQSSNPKVLAPTEEFIKSDRFRFQDFLASTPEEAANPWLLLNKPYNRRDRSGYCRCQLDDLRATSQARRCSGIECRQ